MDFHSINLLVQYLCKTFNKLLAFSFLRNFVLFRFSFCFYMYYFRKHKRFVLSIRVPLCTSKKSVLLFIEWYPFNEAWYKRDPQLRKLIKRSLNSVLKRFYSRKNKKKVLTVPKRYSRNRKKVLIHLTQKRKRKTFFHKKKSYKVHY